MLKQILFAITPTATAIVTATPLVPPRLPANGKRKKKNDNDKQIKKRNSANHFTTINAIKEKNNNKKKAEVRIPIKAVATIAAAALEAGNIYGNNT